jgi:hypothetical protein
MAYIDNHLQAISSHDQAQEQAPICEPVIVPTALVTGFAIETAGDGCVRIVGWEKLPDIGDEMVERRVVTRLVMSNNTAREFAATMRSALAIGGN